MFSSRVRGGKAYAASRKLENLKNFFLKVNMYIKQPRIYVLIQENQYAWLSKI